MKHVPMQAPLFTKEFCFLTLGHFLQSIGWTSMLLLPLLVIHLGANRAEVGLVMGISALGGLAIRPLVGQLIDRWGRRPVLLSGTIILAAGIAPIGWISHVGWALYGARLLIGFGSGTLFAAYFVAAADMIPRSRRTEGLALFGISGLLPISVSAFIDGWGFSPAELSRLYPWVAIIVLSSLACLYPLRESRNLAQSEDDEATAFGSLFGSSLVPVWVIALTFAALVAGFMSFSTVVAQERGLDWPAQLWLSYSGGAVAVRLLGARLPDRLGTHNVIAPALALYVLAFLRVATAETSSDFLWAGLFAGTGHGYCFPVLTSQVVERSAERLRGTALAIFTGLWDFAGLATPPLLGWFADTYDDRTMFIFSSLFGIAGLLGWCIAESRASKSEPPG